MFCSWKAPSSLDFPNLHHVPSGDSQLHRCEKSLCFTDCKAEARSWATLRSHVAALSTASAFTCSSTWEQSLKWPRLSYLGMLSLPRWHPALRGMASEQGLWDCYCRRSLCFVFLFSLVMSLGQRLGSLWWDTSLQRRGWRTASDDSGVAEVPLFLPSPTFLPFLLRLLAPEQGWPSGSGTFTVCRPSTLQQTRWLWFSFMYWP